MISERRRELVTAKINNLSCAVNAERSRHAQIARRCFHRRGGVVEPWRWPIGIRLEQMRRRDMALRIELAQQRRLTRPRDRRRVPTRKKNERGESDLR